MEITHGKLRGRFDETKPDAWSTVELYRTLSLDEVLKERRLPTVTVSEEDFAKQTPPLPMSWHRLFRSEHIHGAPGTEALLEQGKQGKWRSPTASTSRNAIAAFEALRFLRQRQQFVMAAACWKSCIPVDHSIVRFEGSFFLVMASSLSCALLWKCVARNVFCGVLEFQVDPAQAMEWIPVLDETAFDVFPYDPVLSSHESHVYGMVAFHQSRPLVCALAYAIACEGLTKWMLDEWAVRYRVERKPKGTVSERLLAKLLEQHADKDYWVSKLKSGKSVSSEVADLTAAALAGMDEDNLNGDFREEKKQFLGTAVTPATYVPPLAATDTAAHPADPVRDRGQATAPLAVRKPPKVPVRGTPPWLKDLTPGAGSLLQGVLNNSCFQLVDRSSFTAYYELAGDDPRLQKQFQQKSKTRRWGPGSASQRACTEHEALQFVLRWQWQKHRAVSGRC